MLLTFQMLIAAFNLLGGPDAKTSPKGMGYFL